MAKANKQLVPKNPDAIKAFQLIVDTYGLTDPVDQLIANRAAAQLCKLQEFEKWIAEKGGGSVFYDNGEGVIQVHPAAYYIKQIEADFRANIRMLKQKVENKAKTKEGPKDFSKWLEEAEVKEVKDE